MSDKSLWKTENGQEESIQATILYACYYSLKQPTTKTISNKQPVTAFVYHGCLLGGLVWSPAALMPDPLSQKPLHSGFSTEHCSK